DDPGQRGTADRDLCGMNPSRHGDPDAGGDQRQRDDEPEADHEDPPSLATGTSCGAFACGGGTSAVAAVSGSPPTRSTSTWPYARNSRSTMASPRPISAAARAMVKSVNT